MPACTACLFDSEVLANEAGTFAPVVDEPDPETADRDAGEANEEPPTPPDQWTICKHDPSYPTRLRDVPDAPPVLYGFGNFAVLARLDDHNGVAIVGARRASAYGREVSYSIAQDVASENRTIVSGMALGVDGAAHRGALQAGGDTIAVLACGPSTPYPRSHKLLHNQIARAGCVISERPPGYVPAAADFKSRTRIIAALSAIAVFVEGSEDSGAMFTMNAVSDRGGIVGAVPGPITGPLSVGPNHMLAQQNARVIAGASDVLEILDQLTAA